MARLREQEAEVQNEVARALEKENLNTEARIAATTPKDDEGTVVASSASLREDVEEVRRRVERFQKRREELGVQGAESAREEVVKCYRCVFWTLPLPREEAVGLNVCRDHPKRALDCWREVEEFRRQVSALEQVRLCDSDGIMHF